MYRAGVNCGGHLLADQLSLGRSPRAINWTDNCELSLCICICICICISVCLSLRLRLRRSLCLSVSVAMSGYTLTLVLCYEANRMVKQTRLLEHRLLLCTFVSECWMCVINVAHQVRGPLSRPVCLSILSLSTMKKAVHQKKWVQGDRCIVHDRAFVGAGANRAKTKNDWEAKCHMFAHVGTTQF